MPKVSVNPVLARLTWSEFQAWVKRTLPGEDAEKLYVSIGGKVLAKKEKGAE
jgi:hypothetical protein